MEHKMQADLWLCFYTCLKHGVSLAPCISSPHPAEPPARVSLRACWYAGSIQAAINIC